MLKRYMSMFLLSSSIGIVVNSCKPYSPLLGCQQATTSPSISISNLMAATKIIDIEGKKFKLYGSLSTSSAKGSCIDINLKIEQENSTVRLPESYKYESLWVINKKEVWETKSFENKKMLNEQYDIFAFPGPNWDISSNQDILAIVKITDNKGNNYLISSEKLFFSIIPDIGFKSNPFF